MKKIVALALAVIMTMTMFCALTVTSSAADDVKYDATTKIVVADNGDGTSNVKIYFNDESELGIIGCWLELTLENIEIVGNIDISDLYNFLDSFYREDWVLKIQYIIEEENDDGDSEWYINPEDWNHLTVGNTRTITIPWYADSTTPFSLKADVLSEAKGRDIEKYYKVSIADLLAEDGSLLIADFNIVTPEEDASIEIHPINYDTGNFTVNTEIPMTFSGRKDGVGYWDKYEFNKKPDVPPVVPAEVEVLGTSIRYANPQGLRFVAKITANDQVVEGAGMVITADGSEQSLDVPAQIYRENGTYTAVLANIKPSNIKRTFTATPYIVVDGERVVGEGLGASAHDVAIRILTEDPDLGEAVSEAGDRLDYVTVAKALLNLYAAG